MRNQYIVRVTVQSTVYLEDILVRIAPESATCANHKRIVASHKIYRAARLKVWRLCNQSDKSSLVSLLQAKNAAGMLHAVLGVRWQLSCVFQ
jgi:hypothetical protein